jgi:DNA-binding CsgD family transcriptional regulator
MIDTQPPPDRKSRQVFVTGISLFILTISEILLILDVVSEMYGIGFDFYYDYHIEIETTAVFALGIALIFIGANFWRILRENRGYRAMAGLASGEFIKVVDGKFDDWEFSESEREVAFLLIKGLSIQEMADVRETKPGTIKSQGNAIYRKAGVKGRNELVAYFVEDLLGGLDLTTRSSTPGTAPTQQI